MASDERTGPVAARGVATLWRLLPYVRPHRTQLAVGLLCVILGAAGGASVPWLLRAALDELRAGAPLRRIWTIGAIMIGATIGTGVLRYTMRELLNGLSRLVEYDLRNDLFAKLTTLDAGWFGRTRTGDIMARLTNDLGAVRMAAGPAIMYLANTIAGGIFAIACMASISGRLTLLAVIPAISIPIIALKLGKLVHDRFERVQEHFGTLTTHAQENLAGARVVRAYGQEASEIARFTALGEEYLRRNMAMARLNGILNPSFGLLAGLGAVIVLGVGGTMTLNGTISVGSFVAFGLYLGMLTWPLIALGWVINLFQRGAASMARLLDVLDATPSVQTPASPRALPSVGQRGGRSIEFRNVGFYYPGAGEPDGTPRWVLRGVSVRVEAGQTLGIVGNIGSGKTALLDLVPRFHDPQEGDVLLDGISLRDLALDAVRREIGMVPQESLLFSDTVASNLQYGLDAPDDVAMRWSAQVAQLGESIEGFSAGYDTMLGERGINLSGGQKQRAALARALARKPAVVLLDDALSAVDTHTEAEILRGLGSALRGRTALIASHRISAIRDADHIIVLDGGRVVEQGTHDALLEARGRYWQLLNRQLLQESVEEEAVAEA